jgi:uncharacterized protein DUF4440
MRITRYLAALLVAISAAEGADTAIPSDLQQAMRERGTALDAGDAAAWDRLTSADFTAVDNEGNVLTKAERLAALKKQGPVVRRTSEEQVRMYGNTAVQRSRVGDVRAIQVWVRQPQGWQVVATQLTSVAKK